MLRRFIPLILLFLVVFITVGCMGDDDDDDSSASPVSDVTVDEVLQSASDTWAATESAHFKLEVDGDAYLDEDESVKLLSAEGDIKRPGSVDAGAKIDSPLGPLDISLRAVDGEIYITSFITGDWESAPDDFSYDPSVLFSDTDGIGPVMEDLQNPTLEGTEDVNGVQAYKVAGTVGANRVEAITGGSIRGDAIEVTIWTAVDDAKLLRVVLTEPEGVRESPATWNLLMTEHNKDVDIQAPLVSTQSP